MYRQETATTICIRIQGLRFNILQFCFNQILGNLFHYKEHHVVMLEWKSQVTEERLHSIQQYRYVATGGFHSTKWTTVWHKSCMSIINVKMDTVLLRINTLSQNIILWCSSVSIFSYTPTEWIMISMLCYAEVCLIEGKIEFVDVKNTGKFT